MPFNGFECRRAAWLAAGWCSSNPPAAVRVRTCFLPARFPTAWPHPSPPHPHAHPSNPSSLHTTQVLDGVLKEIATALLQADVNVRLVANLR